MFIISLKKLIHNYCLLYSIIMALLIYIPAADAASVESPQQAKPHRVLVISSYSYDWDSIPKQLDGIQSVLGETCTINYLFMDTKNYEEATAIDMFYPRVRDYLKINLPYDLVIISDDPALNFAMQYRQELFKNIPLVFEGINTPARAQQVYNQDNLITGVVEDFPFNETIILAKHIYPQATKILAVSDDTVSGIGSLKQFYQCQAVHPDLNFYDINASKMTRSEIASTIASLDDKTIILFLMLTEDKSGTLYTLPEGIRLITNNSSHPVFKADEVGINYGLLGGKVISYEHMGRTAGEIALQILNGKPPHDIPINTTSQYFLFDRTTMDKYSINKSQLPETAIFLNDYLSFWEKYNHIIIPVGIILFFFISILIGILYDNARRRRLINALKETNRILFLRDEISKMLLDETSSIIFEYFIDSDLMEYAYMSLNSQYTKLSIPKYRQTFTHYTHFQPKYQTTVTTAFELLSRQVSTETLEVIGKFNTDTPQWYRISMKSLPDENGHVFRIIGKAQNIQSEIAERERYKEQLSYREILIQNTVFAATINLTQNTFKGFATSTNILMPLTNASSADDFLAQFNQLVIPNTDNHEFTAITQRQNLLAAFEKQKNHFSMEHIFSLDETHTIWLETIVTLIKNPSTGDVEAFIHSTDINKEKITQDIMNRAIASDYDFLVYIDGMNGQQIAYMNTDKGSFLPPLSIVDFDTTFSQYIKSSVKPDEQLHLLESLSLKKILARLDKESDFFVYFTGVDVNNSFTKKKLHFSYINPVTRKIALTETDITNIYLEEQHQNNLLQQALTEAKNANKAKSDFLSRMSHEIRTPMNAIIGFTTLALAESNDPTALHYLDKINTSSNFLLGLLNEILDMSKIENKKMRISAIPVKLDTYLNETLNLIKPQIEAKGIAFTFSKSVDLPVTVALDKLHMKQIILNLLTNAFKFTPSGGRIDFIIKQQARTQTTTSIQMIIRDNGCGISPEFMQKLFLPFEQESQQISATYTGTGLGLSIVKNLVELMKGTISVNSTLGKGSEFTISLNLPIIEQTSTDKSLPEAPSDNSRLKAKRILLTEDNEINQEIAEMILTKKGMLVDIAANGQIAVDKFKASESGFYDAILMDIRMPVMDGLAATAMIRELEHPDAKTIPIIAMTANAFDEDIQKSLAVGMNAHLSKPIKTKILYDTLLNYIK